MTRIAASDTFLDAVRHQPSPGRTRASGGYVGRNYLLNGYRQIFPVKTDPIDNTMDPPPFLQIGRIDIAAAMEEEFNDWYNTAYIPGYLTVPGCIRARRYLAVEGQPKYLTVYELENARVPDTLEWARAVVAIHGVRACGHMYGWTRVRQRRSDGSGLYESLAPRIRAVRREGYAVRRRPRPNWSQQTP